MAALDTYDYKLCLEICDLVMDGANIKTALKSSDKYPTFQTWCNWKRNHAELFDLYVKAIQDKSESVLEEIDSISLDLRKGLLEPSVANVLIQTLKWKAAKFYPKMFGDKVDHDVTVTNKLPTREEREKYIKEVNDSLIKDTRD
jgi:hypothetical protein